MGIDSIYFRYPANIQYPSVWNFAACACICYELKDSRPGYIAKLFDQGDESGINRRQFIVPIDQKGSGGTELSYYFKEYLGIDLDDYTRLDRFSEEEITEVFSGNPSFDSNYVSVAGPLADKIQEVVKSDPIMARNGFMKIRDDFTGLQEKMDKVIEAIEKFINEG